MSETLLLKYKQAQAEQVEKLIDLASVLAENKGGDCRSILVQLPDGSEQKLWCSGLFEEIARPTNAELEMALGS